jgi:hypothetical protein
VTILLSLLPKSTVSAKLSSNMSVVARIRRTRNPQAPLLNDHVLIFNALRDFDQHEMVVDHFVGCTDHPFTQTMCPTCRVLNYLDAHPTMERFTKASCCRSSSAPRSCWSHPRSRSDCMTFHFGHRSSQSLSHPSTTVFSTPISCALLNSALFSEVHNRYESSPFRYGDHQS